MKSRLLKPLFLVLLAMAFSATEMPGAVSAPQLPHPGDTGVT